MRRSPIWLSLAVLAAPAALAAQQPYSECNQALVTISQQNINICNAAVDGATVFHPVLGLLVSGGNPVLGSTKTLGGFPHVSLTARVNATKLSVPDLGFDGSTTTVNEEDEIFAPAPLVEGALGILKGFGPSGMFSVDLLASAQLLPTNQVDNLSVDDDARKIGDIALGLGIGARVGVIRGRGPIPNVTVSVMRRSIPKITYGDQSGGDTYEFGLDLQATNLRAVAGYKLAMLSFGAGLGYDKYTGDVDISFESQAVPGTVIPVSLDLDNSRTMVFLTGALDFPVVKIGAEVGYQMGKDQSLRTTFENNDPGDSRLFAGLGLRFAF
jgi:hypothetical protein